MFETIKIKHHLIQLLDQRFLPNRVEYIDVKNIQDAYNGIKKMIVRGAPAIGVTAAFGIALGFKGTGSAHENLFQEYKEYLLASRPTAVNLLWALDRQEELFKIIRARKPLDIFHQLFENAKYLYHEDIEINKKIGEFGQGLLKEQSIIITHCNAGSLATCGWGTALGVIRSGFRNNKVKLVYADETRPYLQGSRLTAWELSQDGIPVRVITDSASAYIIDKYNVDCAVVGADRIAANGDTANKIGTFLLAINCKYHNVPFYVAAPSSTFDLTLNNGSQICVEHRDRSELRKILGINIIPDDIDAENPSFDITPNELITAYITERGIIKGSHIRQALQD